MQEGHKTSLRLCARMGHVHVAPQSVVVARVSHSLVQLAGLIALTEKESLPEPARIACLESWAMNQRLLVEFLLLNPPKNCARATSLLPDWDYSHVGYRDRLKEDYGWASQYVAHIAVPKPDELERNLHPDALAAKTDLVIDAAAELARQMSDAQHEYAGLMALAVAKARQLVQDQQAPGTPGRSSAPNAPQGGGPCAALGDLLRATGQFARTVVRRLP